MIIRGVHRAYRGTDNLLDAWVRDEAGPVDLSAAAPIEVRVMSGRRVVATVVAAGAADGHLTFTLGAELIKARPLWRSHYRLIAVAGGAVIYTGDLEVV